MVRAQFVRIVQVNAVYDPATRTPGDLLDLYSTLTEWSAAVAQAGATVSVVQRFHTDARIEREGVTYLFVKDTLPPWLSTTDVPPAFVQAVVAQAADVIHVNGLIFPQLVSAIRQAAGDRPAIVVQHHGGEFPIRGSGPVGMWRRMKWRGGLSAADAVSFTSAEQAAPWREAEVLGSQRVLEIIEAGTTLRSVARERARAATNVTGNPVILWVGRLTENKDPLTVLAGLEQALPRLPGAAVVMAFGDETLLPNVTTAVEASAILSKHVTLVGQVARDEMPNYYSAADVFISGSHSEGSGYALIEAMSSGLVPVVTDIPAFRAVAGSCGARWTPGDAGACASALLDVCGRDAAAARAEVRAHYDRALRWEAIAARTVSEYQGLVDQKRRVS